MLRSVSRGLAYFLAPSLRGQQRGHSTSELDLGTFLFGEYHFPGDVELKVHSYRSFPPSFFIHIQPKDKPMDVDIGLMPRSVQDSSYGRKH